MSDKKVVGVFVRFSLRRCLQQEPYVPPLSIGTRAFQTHLNHHGQTQIQQNSSVASEPHTLSIAVGLVFFSDTGDRGRGVLYAFQLQRHPRSMDPRLRHFPYCLAAGCRIPVRVVPLLSASSALLRGCKLDGSGVRATRCAATLPANNICLFVFYFKV
jgi:hypothetical protein